MWSAVGAILSIAALAFATPATADETDDAFIAGLAKGGITMLDNDNAIAMAHTVCTNVATNPNVSMLALQLAKQTALSPKQSGYFIGASVVAYCPQYKNDVDPSFGWLMPPPLM
ncbi:hypothetical protein B8W69_14350 [Mycobacterium vulneris]|uniref:DUF732 domain-containing protein n=1 Tax=Mycolicibacterium vulneris TaxID=547163 RepID=A0A1X2L051_9MYCO|nr:DUF732 domain-containing protein [Mycolicibacterium vulneris]OSC27362.1 hypothetical protein B8W69_14350 [Mycolicibacterium vulneris]